MGEGETALWTDVAGFMSVAGTYLPRGIASTMDMLNEISL
jgi:hypothetical protein